MTLAVGALRRGQLVVLPTETAYAVACDAFSAEGVDRLEDAKQRRSAGALPVMVGSVHTIDGIVTGLSPTDRELLRGFWPGLLTVVCRPQASLARDLGGDSDRVPVRMPLHPLALDVLRQAGPLVVMTANRTGAPAPTDAGAAADAMGAAAAFTLDAGPRPPGPPSTVVDLVSQPPLVLREGALETRVLRHVLPTLGMTDA